MGAQQLAGRLSATFHVRKGISTAFADEEDHRAERVPQSAIAAAASANAHTHGGLSGSSSFKASVERAYTVKRTMIDYLAATRFVQHHPDHGQRTTRPPCWQLAISGELFDRRWLKVKAYC